MKKICLLLVLALLIFVFLLNPLRISATSDNESNEEIKELSTVCENTSIRSIPGGEDTHGEEWYNLSDDAPILTKSADYSAIPELLQYLKPGDIIYETNGSPIGDMTKHIAIVYDIVWSMDHNQYYVAIIEAYLGGVGFGIMTPNRLEEKDVIIYRLTTANESKIQGALTFIEGQLGKPYRFHLSKSDDYNSADWYCSELVWAAYLSEEIKLDWDDNNDNGTPILPAALASNPQLTTILHYTDENDEDKYETNLTNNGATGHTYNCDGDTYTEEHFYRFWTTGEETHTATCACGYTITENHSLEYENLDESDYHREYCTVCTYNETVSHDYKCYGTIGEFHCEMCLECGYHHMGLVNIPYTSVDANNHSKECPDCGYTSTEAHDYETYNFCYEKCSDCGNVRQAKEHSYTYRYEEIDTISHYSYCECGKQRNDLHNFKLVGMMNVCENCNCRVNAEHVHSYTYTPRNDGKNHIKECSCGIFVMEQCLGEMSLGGQSLCSKCGQVVRSGIGILSDEDDDALPFNKEDDDYLE